MAFPTVTHGLRRIAINEKTFRWRFKAREYGSVLWVYGETPRPPLRVIFPGFQDSWAIIFPNTSLPCTEIGPAFVRTAIEFGLKRGWTPDTQGAPFEIEWNGEAFRVVEKSSPDLHEQRR